MKDEVVLQNDKELELTEQDALFVLLRREGQSSMDAAVEAYSSTNENVRLAQQLRDSNNPKDREQGKLMLRKFARSLVNRKKIKILDEELTKRMHELGGVALDTMEELMIEGRSEKVRADVAIEVARQNLGSPDKSEKSDQNIVIMIGNDPSQQIKTDVIDGEEV